MAILKQTNPPESEVRALQKALKSSGYDLGNYGENKDGIDGKLGKKTIAALKDFSKRNPVIGEKYSGITGYKPEGSENKLGYTERLQKTLVDKGYDLGTYGKNKDGIDGKMGKKTIAALKDLASKDSRFANEYKDILPDDFKPQVPTIQRPTGVGVMYTAKQDGTRVVTPQGQSTKITDPLQAAAKFLPKQEAPHRPVLSATPEPKKQEEVVQEEQDYTKASRSDMGDSRPIGKTILDAIFFPEKKRNRISNSIRPYEYNIKQIKEDYYKNINNPAADSIPQELDMNNPFNVNRNDALRMYADLPQSHGTFKPSKYRPSVGYEDYKQAYTFSDPKERERYLKMAAQFGLLDRDINAPLSERQINFNDAGHKGGNSVMNTGTLGLGKDEQGEYVSFSDIWDLAGKDDTSIGRSLYGRPFLIYDRFYLTPEEKNKLRSMKRKKQPAILDSSDAGKSLQNQVTAIKDDVKNFRIGSAVSSIRGILKQ